MLPFKNICRCLAFSSSLLLTAMYLSSCEKVLSLDLNKVEKKYVVEASLTDQPGSCIVSLTQTKNFDENNTFAGTSGARVTITDNNGAPVTLAESTPGIYTAPLIKGIPGHTYELRILIDGQLFTSITTMPALVTMDSLYITEMAFFDETNKYATVVYKDPPGLRNAYRFVQYVNGVKEKTIFVRDDDSNDGLTVNRTLLYFYDDEEADARKIKTGDTLRIEMLCISYPVYKFWYSLTESSTGENQSATPGNPITNINGGALGYFSVHAIQSKTLRVP